MPSSHATATEKENSVPYTRPIAKNFEAEQGNKEGRNGGDTREFPCTPAGRVPLADLIGNNEDNQDDTPKASPLDAVTWEQGPMSSGETAHTPIMRKGKKRRRSLTPTFSQQALAVKPTLQLEAFKTPQNDPAKELENRYFARSKLVTPSKPSSSAAPDFMHSSSPTTPVAGSGDSGKLRRTVSCGVAWPSGNKRRRTASEKDIKLRKSPTVEFTTADRQGELQKINMLLDSIHHNMLEVSRDSPPRHSRPSGALQTDYQPCETRLSQPLQSHYASQPSQVLQQQVEDDHSQLLQHRELSEIRGSSEFGDADLDSAFAGIADPTGLSSPLCDGENYHADAPIFEVQDEIQAPIIQLQPTRTEVEDPSVSLHLSQSTQQKLRLNHESDGYNNDDDDEFNDNEFDELSADMVQIASMYDTQEPVDPMRANGAQPGDPANAVIQELPIQPELESALPAEDAARLPGVENVVNISDDEFGDDDFEELANELERATQAGEEISTVRWSSQRL